MKVSELKSLLEGMSDYDDVTINGKPIEAVEMKQDTTKFNWGAEMKISNLMGFE